MLFHTHLQLLGVFFVVFTLVFVLCLCSCICALSNTLALVLPRAVDLWARSSPVLVATSAVATARVLPQTLRAVKLYKSPSII